MAQKNEIVMYQPDEAVKIEVRLENETVWLTQQQMAELFQTTRNNALKKVLFCSLKAKDQSLEFLALFCFSSSH